jgi:hypothetical protein
MTGMSAESGAAAPAVPTIAQDISTSSNGLEEVRQPERRKVKIDGVEEEVDVDSVVRDYQKYKSSEKRFQEAAQLRKEAQAKEELINQLLTKAQSGDLSWLKGLVPDDQLRGWAESQLLEHIDWESKPEAERRAIMAERKARELEERVNEFTQTKEREEASKMEEQVYQEVESEIIDAIKTMGLDMKLTPRYIRRIAEHLQANIGASQDPQYKPISAKVAAQKAFKSLKVDTQELLSILPLNEVLEMLPPSVRKGIRQADVEDAIAQAPMMRARKEQGSSQASPRSKLKHQPSEDAFKELEKRFS